MNYSVTIRDPRMVEHREFKDYFLDGLYPVELMTAEAARDMGICKHCELAYQSHPLHWIGPNRARLMCTVLFHDVIRPKWRPEQLV